MKKKIFLAAAFVLLETAGFAQQITGFGRTGNMNAEQFRKSFSTENSAMGDWTYRKGTLPVQISQLIHNALRNYTLDIGDVFFCTAYFYGVSYIVSLRITNAKDRRWEHYTWAKT